MTRIPKINHNQEIEDSYLVKEFNVITDALALKDVVYSTESGRFWRQHAQYFDSAERVDQVLLKNLVHSHRSLRDKGLTFDSAQALLIQVMFIAYLEDREIIRSEYFLNVSNSRANNFSSILETENIDSLFRLFKKLHQDFGGDLFVAPLSFENETLKTDLTHDHLSILRHFRTGIWEKDGDYIQGRFWGYDFKYIPTELISAVYDRFLAEHINNERRTSGAYYTPMFLADTVLSQLWDRLSPPIKNKGEFLDPACGSGIFLVRSFQRLCEHWRQTHSIETIRWDSLCAIVKRLHGWDINSSAIRVAVFSLYLAVLGEVNPPDIQRLIKRGRFLPKLFGKSLRQCDFFDSQHNTTQVDVLTGNPPWISRKGADNSAVKWCIDNSFPIPSRDCAWAFVWKSLRHLRNNGIVAFLLPAMGFLHNHSKIAVAARNRLIRETRIYRIVNFADLRFQLFEHAIRPAALIVYGEGEKNEPNYRFDYWVPKADPNLKTKRMITLSTTDKCVLNTQLLEIEPNLFKHRLWMKDPEARLFNYLSKLPKLCDLVEMYSNISRRNGKPNNGWVIGQGFKPARRDRLLDSNYEYTYSETVIEFPYLPISKYRALFQSRNGLHPYNYKEVHRKGFVSGFQGPRILIPRGVDTVNHRLRASYIEAPLTFENIIQTIVVPSGEEPRAKLLTSLLNSKLILWFAFHDSASFGSERPEVRQSELLHLPFPSSEDMPDPVRSRTAMDALVSLIDNEVTREKQPLGFDTPQSVFQEIDELTYEYYCLSEDEISVVDETADKIIPNVQPRRDSYPDIWNTSTLSDRRTYADTLIRNLIDWFDNDYVINIRLEARNSDLAILRLSLQDAKVTSSYEEMEGLSISNVLSSLFEQIMLPLPGNFQLIPDFRIFVENKLYLVKPNQKRFWLKTSAISDANNIALDLQDSLFNKDRQMGKW